MEEPTIGRIVHYVYEDGTHRPAIIVSVIEADVVMVQLQVFNDADPKAIYNDQRPAMDWKTSIEFDEDGAPGTCHWPER